MNNIDKISKKYLHKFGQAKEFLNLKEYTKELLNYMRTELGARKIAAGIDYIFFDEFQDIN